MAKFGERVRKRSMRKPAVVAVLVVLAASIAVLVASLTGHGSNAHAPNNTLIVINRLVGPFSIGERQAKVEAVAGKGRVVLSRNPTDGEYFGSLMKVYRAVSIRVIYLTRQGKAGLFAVETTSSEYRTKSGIGVGSTVEQVKKIGAYCDSLTSCNIQNTDAGTSTYFVLDKSGARVIRIGVGTQFN